MDTTPGQVIDKLEAAAAAGAGVRLTAAEAAALNNRIAHLGRAVKLWRPKAPGAVA